MNKYTFQIDRQECVGDSVAKHNYNALSLDSFICNLSSEIFNAKNNILSIFNNISNNSADFGNVATQFSNQNSANYNVVRTTVNLLSSYWASVEFTVQFEHNLYTPDDINNYYDGSPINAYTSSTSAVTLLKVGYDYLNSNFPARNFPPYAISNVVIFLYNSLNVNSVKNISTVPKDNTTFFAPITNNPSAAFALSDDYNPNNYGFVDSQLNVGVTRNKTIAVDFSKTDIHLDSIFTASYQAIPNSNTLSWQPIRYISNDQTISLLAIPAAQPYISLLASDPPPYPCVGTPPYCSGATLTISYDTGSDTGSANIYLSTTLGVLGRLCSTVLTRTGTYRFTNLLGNTTYYITLVNDKNKSSVQTMMTTPAYVGLPPVDTNNTYIGTSYVFNTFDTANYLNNNYLKNNYLGTTPNTYINNNYLRNTSYLGLL